MAALHPLAFDPLFKERVWGGRRLADLYGKRLPLGPPIGESWEVTDRPEGVSSIRNGPLAGRTIRDLMLGNAGDLLGQASSQGGRFPLLVKLLDARDVLSVQVHPPAARAAALGGEPKTEIWYVAEADPGAVVYAGLKRGVTRAEFERRIGDGTVAECLHRIAVEAGDVLFLPSGRVHALGGGLVIFEIQQNSDTTYRVFDWNRTGLDGRPRELHVEASLESIDFEDFEPQLEPRAFVREGGCDRRRLARNDLFDLNEIRACEPVSAPIRTEGRPVLLAMLEGSLVLQHPVAPLRIAAGQFAVIPSCVSDARLEADAGVRWLHCQPGPNGRSAGAIRAIGD